MDASWSPSRGDLWQDVVVVDLRLSKPFGCGFFPLFYSRSGVAKLCAQNKSATREYLEELVL